MAFYLIINGKLTDHEFEYLSKDSGRRLEPTKAPIAKKKQRADQSPNSYVIEIMQKDVKTLNSSDSIESALNLFRNKDIHHLPVLNDYHLEGFLSHKDLLTHSKTDTKQTLNNIMNDLVIVCDENTALDHLAKVFYTEKINGMPVINSKNKLVGIVTHHDILRWVFDKTF